MSLLVSILLVPVIAALVVGLAARLSNTAVRITALVAMLADLVLAAVLFISVKDGALGGSHAWMPSFGVNFSLYADGLSAILILLTAVLGVVAVLISWDEIEVRAGSFHMWLLLLQTGILLVFTARDMMLFYFGWELMLIPMFFIIGGWGHEDKLRAAVKFLLFTFTGSIFMLLSLLYLYAQHYHATGTASFGLPELIKTGAALSVREQILVFFGLFIGFAVKVPLFPLHTWLPDAHTQAPTAGSLILAGLLLKTGTYGLLRVAIPLVPQGALALAPLAISCALVGIFYGALVAFAQRDLKRLIAYSSISHLGFVVLGIFVANSAGVQGAVLQMVNHGLATGALFLIAGMLQHRTHTRLFENFGGMWARIPVIAAFLLFFSFATLGLPGTGNFIGELYVIGGAFTRNYALGGAAAFGVLFGAVYALRLFTGTMQGPVSERLKPMPDSNVTEGISLGVLAAALIIIGFFPSSVTDLLSAPPANIIPTMTPHVGRVFIPQTMPVAGGRQ